MRINLKGIPKEMTTGGDKGSQERISQHIWIGIQYGTDTSGGKAAMKGYRIRFEYRINKQRPQGQARQSGEDIASFLNKSP